MSKSLLLGKLKTHSRFSITFENSPVFPVFVGSFYICEVPQISILCPKLGFISKPRNQRGCYAALLSDNAVFIDTLFKSKQHINQEINQVFHVCFVPAVIVIFIPF